MVSTKFNEISTSVISIEHFHDEALWAVRFMIWGHLQNFVAFSFKFILS